MAAVDGIVEGHLAHLLPCDRVVVLRCRPDILRERLAPRDYPEEKIAENARWTKEFLAPWIHRRVTGRSSGDGLSPKRPRLEPIG